MAPQCAPLSLGRRLAPPIALACLAMGLTGCAVPNMVLTPPPVELTSPIKADIEAASAADVPYPRFRDVPQPPKDIRPLSAYTRNIYNTLRLRREQKALEVLYPQTLLNTEAWAGGERKQVLAPPAMSAEAQTAKSEAYAKTLRDQARPPSAPQ